MSKELDEIMRKVDEGRRKKKAPVIDEEVVVKEPEPVVEGPTIAMKMVAEQAGIPLPLIELATSDSQLEKFVELARQAGTPSEPDFKLELPEEEYPEDDPVRKEFTRLQSHFATQLESMKVQLGETSRTTREFTKQQVESAEQQARKVQSEFDKTLDELEIGAFGNTKNMSSANFHVRSAAFNLLQELKQKSPDSSVAELAKQVAEQLSFTTNNRSPKEIAAIRKQASRRLGGGPSQPASPGKRSDEAVMREFLVAAGYKD